MSLVVDNLRSGGRAYAALACALVFFQLLDRANFEAVAPVDVVVAVAALVLVALAIFGKIGPRTALAFTVVAGIALRLAAGAFEGSDVSDATAEALATVAHGGNPYAHVYVSTRPPGSPFVYLPGELGLYALQSALPGGLAPHDRWWGMLVLVGIAALGPVCGYGRAALACALYGTSAVAITRSVDGSNDTGLAFVTVGALVALAYATAAARGRAERSAAARHLASAVLFGWALAFKALAWFVFPFVVLFVAGRRRLRYAVVALAVAAVLTVPFAATAPAAFAHALAQMYEYHTTIYGFDVWTGLLGRNDVPSAPQPLGIAILLRLRPVAVVCILWALWRRAPVLGVAVAQGALWLAAALLLAPWSTVSYYTYLIALGAVALAASGLAREPEELRSARSAEVAEVTAVNIR